MFFFPLFFSEFVTKIANFLYCGSPKVIMTLYDSYLFHSSDVKVLLVMYAGFDTNRENKRGQ